MKLTGSEIFCEVLQEQGVDTVFGYPGGAALNLYDALYKHQDRIRHIITAHEQGAAHAADGYARATGRTGVVLATSGPGATNLVTGIATAYMDSIPLVAITCNVPKPLMGQDSFQEVYIAGITMPITKHNYVVYDVNELADTMREARSSSISPRTSPPPLPTSNLLPLCVTNTFLSSTWKLSNARRPSSTLPNALPSTLAAVSPLPVPAPNWPPL